MIKNKTVKVSDIRIKSLGVVEDTVYDVEVTNQHNFFANNILVHNSNYYRFEKILMEHAKEDLNNPDLKYEELTDAQIIDYMLHLDKTLISNIIKSNIKHFGEMFNTYDNRFKMKHELIIKNGLYYKTKMYATAVLYDQGKRYENENKKIKIIGLTLKKTIYSKFIRNRLKKIVQTLLIEPEEFINEYNLLKHDFFQRDVNDIAMISSVNFKKNSKKKSNNLKKSNNYKLGDSKIPIYVRGALAFNEMSEGRKIINQEKVKYLYLHNHEHYYVIAYPNEPTYKNWLKQSGMIDFVDKEMQFEKSIYNSLKNICNIIGLSLEHELVQRKFRTIEEEREYYKNRQDRIDTNRLNNDIFNF